MVGKGKIKANFQDSSLGDWMASSAKRCFVREKLSSVWLYFPPGAVEPTGTDDTGPLGV